MPNQIQWIPLSLMLAASGCGQAASKYRIFLLSLVFLITGCESKTPEKITEISEPAHINSAPSTPNAQNLVFHRNYNDSHLKNQPQQTVAEILIKLEKLDQQQITEFGGHFNQFANIYIRFKDSPAWFFTAGQCYDSVKYSYECNVDGDEGHFLINLQQDNMRIEFEHLLVWLCGVDEEDIRNGEIPDGINGLNVVKGGDDLFILPAADPNNRQNQAIFQHCESF